MLHEPAITTRNALKQIVQNGQMGLLKFARTFNNPPAAATAGLGALQREDLETRRKTNPQVVELQRRFGPHTTNSVEDKMPMELDAMQRARDDDEEYYSDDGDKEADDTLFFMEPDHDKIRSKENPETQDYWEAGITTDTISVLKQGNMDHSQKTCYHCNRKGHIKANCPERKKSGARPWTKHPGSQNKKMLVSKGYGVGKRRGKQFSSQPGNTKR